MEIHSVLSGKTSVFTGKVRACSSGETSVLTGKTSCIAQTEKQHLGGVAMSFCYWAAYKDVI